MAIALKHYRDELIKFLRSTDFSKAIVLTIAMIVPIGIFYAEGTLELGISIAMGCLLSSPSDVPGSFKHKVIGVVSAALLGSISFLTAGYWASGLVSSVSMLFFMMFGISYLSVYGFRASLVSFAGLLAVVLSFANLSSGIEIWQKSLLILAGGLWYLLLSISWYLIRPARATEQLLAETMELTAEYLRLRSRLLLEGSNEEKIQKDLFNRQVELNEHHESLREILISSRRTGGLSAYTRKRLLVFIDLVDMLELAMANPIDFRKMKTSLQEHPQQLETVGQFSRKLATQLENISLALFKKTPLPAISLAQDLKKVKKDLNEFRNSIDISKERESLILLYNLFDYQSKQVDKILHMDRILRNLEETDKISLKTREIKKFLTQQDYSYRTLVTNFNFESAFFRHALRLSILVVIAYVLGSLFPFQNSYWILLTIVVIMRPNYGLTKIRTRKRIVGTLIGGTLAIGIVLLTHNPLVYSILGLLSLTLAFSLIQRNYTTAAIFITLSIIFIYALLQPDVQSVIKFRILDTIVGAGLAAAGNFILWPKWEFENIGKVLSHSLTANLEYLKEIDWYYHKKKLPLSYKLARKKAFLEMGNLTGAFQRMTQEPKSRQTRLGLIYEIVEINNAFLSALASMGTYIRTHPTTAASTNFEIYIASITGNMENSIELLEGKNITEKKANGLKEAVKALDDQFASLAGDRDRELEKGYVEITEHTRNRLQEAHLINTQLKWLLHLSTKLQEKLKKLKLRNEQKSL